MGYLDNTRTITDFIRFTNAGVDIASFTQIRDAITTRYKEVYGQDIDLTVAPTNADGIFVNDLALMVNNILQSIKTMYANLDVNTASGVYLDNLCRLSNIVRKSATPSNVYITVKNIGNDPITIKKSSDADGTTFVDVSGAEWLYEGNDVILNAGTSQLIQVFSSIAGEVEAVAGSIVQAIGNQYLEVTQPTNANLGNDAETDSELRARRAQSVGATGATVLDALTGALLNITAIRDVKIYNNNTNANTTALDGTVIGPHSIYVIVRREDGIIVPDSTIGQLISDMLTPGIGTTEPAVATKKSYNVTRASQYLSLADEVFHWKECVPVTTGTITITLNKFANYSNETAALIQQRVIEYFDVLPIGQAPNQNDVLFTVMTADPTFNGLPTYSVTSITGIPTTNADTYFKFNASNIEVK